MFITPQQYFRQSGTRPRKRFGQHFLTQAGVAERIVEGAGLQPSDIVVEIGPGLGALTQYILPKVRLLHLVELDRDLAEYLRTNTQSFGCKVFVHQQDVMSFSFSSVSQLAEQRLVVLGNLPYNISSPLLFRLLESRSSIRKAVFMVQKEVGERLAASPGNKDYGVLSVLLGTYGTVSRLFSVGSAQFYPPPKVDSLIVFIDFEKEPPEDAPSFDFLKRMVNFAFQQRRKTLHNSLKPLVAHAQRTGLLEEAFSRSGINSGRRPETLSPGEFQRLAKALEVGLIRCGFSRADWGR